MAFDNLVLDPAPTIAAAARRDWRWYAPGWVFPLVLLGWHTAEAAGATGVPFALLSLLQAGAFFAAGALWLLGRATYRQFAVLGVVAPFAVWVAGVAVRLAVLAALGRPDLV